MPLSSDTPQIPSFGDTWRGFDREVIDDEGADMTLIRVAYYGGAIAIMSIIHRISLEYGEAHSEQAMRALERELQDFAASHGAVLEF
jgi:hypothetical protein